MTWSIVLQSLDELNFDPSRDDCRPPEGYRRLAGLWLQLANMNDHNRFGMQPIAGPIVRYVDYASPAQIAGVLPGDMIVEIDGTPANTLPGGSEDLVKAVSRHISGPSSERIVVLRIRRNREELILKN